MRMVIRPTFEEACKFSGGLACVRVGKKWGYIDTTGKTIVSPQFDDVFHFHEKWATVKVRGM